MRTAVTRNRPQTAWGTPRTVYSTTAWFSVLEKRPDVTAYYVVTTGDDGTVLGVLPAFLHQHPPSFYDPGVVFGEVFGDRWRPVLLAGNRSTCNELLLHPRCARNTVLRAQARVLRELAQSTGAEGIAAMYLNREDANAVADALGDSAVLAGGVGCEITMDWPDFDTYLATLNRRHRHRIRQEMRIFADAGHTTLVRALGDALDTVEPLVADVDHKHGNQAHHDEIAAYAQFFPEAASTFLCKDKAGHPVGCTVWLRDTSALYCRFAGFDYSRTGACEYFNLMFYEPIRYAISTGIERIHLGLATRAKLLRQVTTQPLYAALWRSGWNTGSFATKLAEWNSREQYLGLD